jgi:uncharacterized protein YegP (UPF0339 family)
MSTFEVYKDASGQFRWRLKAANNKVVADSGESYVSKDKCLHGIEVVKSEAATAVVKDET